MRVFHGDGSRRRRGCDVDIPWRAATPRLRVAAAADGRSGGGLVRGYFPDEPRRRRGRGRGYSVETGRGDAAAAGRIVRGGRTREGGSVTGTCGSGSRLRRGRDVDTPRRRVAATPRPPRGHSVETGRGDAAAATWTLPKDESRRRRGRDADSPWRRGAATPRGHSAEASRGCVALRSRPPQVRAALAPRRESARARRRRGLRSTRRPRGRRGRGVGRGAARHPEARRARRPSAPRLKRRLRGGVRPGPGDARHGEGRRRVRPRRARPHGDARPRRPLPRRAAGRYTSRRLRECVAERACS